MSLTNAAAYLKGLVNNTSKKSEREIYQEFIQIITGLEKRNFSENDIHDIEKQLDTLELNSTDQSTKKYIRKALSQFKKYLKDTFSLTVKGHYAKMGIGLGMSYGILFGVVFLSSFERSMGISAGLMIGMFIGLIIGRTMDSRAESAGLTL